jgi:hypothetical protein
VFSVLWNTALHTHVDPAALSRVSAYDVVGSIALVPLGELAAGLGVEVFGAPPTLLVFRNVSLVNLDGHVRFRGDRHGQASAPAHPERGGSR